MTVEMSTDPAVPNTWIVAEHKTLESCIQYFGHGKWIAWTDPAVKIGDVFVSRMGRFVVTAVEQGTEPNQWHAVTKPELATTQGVPR